MSDIFGTSIRAHDLDGGTWLIPPGSVLHGLLVIDVGKGNGPPYLPITAIRDEHIPRTRVDITKQLEEWQHPTFGRHSTGKAEALWRLGQYVRLHERVYGNS